MSEMAGSKNDRIVDQLSDDTDSLRASNKLLSRNSRRFGYPRGNAEGHWHAWCGAGFVEGRCGVAYNVAIHSANLTHNATTVTEQRWGVRRHQ